jgi:hypothetical protein
VPLSRSTEKKGRLGSGSMRSNRSPKQPSIDLTDPSFCANKSFSIKLVNQNRKVRNRSKSEGSNGSTVVDRDVSEVRIVQDTKTLKREVIVSPARGPAL